MESVKTVTSLSLGSVLKRPEQTTTKPPTKPFVMASTLPPNSLGGGLTASKVGGFFFSFNKIKGHDVALSRTLILCVPV